MMKKKNDYSCIYSIDQVSKWRVKLEEIYGVKLSDYEVHSIFEKYNVQKKIVNKGGRDLKFYNKSNIVDLINGGYIKKEIEQIKNGRNYLKNLRKLPSGNQISEPSNEPQKRNGRYVIINNTQPETFEDWADYKNGENDMEIYSDYLINNVYQFENKINKIKNNKIMSKRIIKESELCQIIEESVKRALYESMVNENDLEEGVWDNLKSGFKGAFGGDVERAKQGIEKGANAVKNFGSRVKQGATDMYNNTKQGVQNAYNNAAKGVNQRVDAFKANYQASQNVDKINGVISTLRELQNNGVISGAKTNATIAELERCLNMGMKGMKGRAQQVTNKIGK